jgi:hypothetical protein
MSKFIAENHVECKNVDECFRKIRTDSSKILATSRSHAANNPFAYIDHVDYFCFPFTDNIVIYSTVLMFRKYHHLAATFNEKIRIVAESGLLQKWQSDSKRSEKRNFQSGRQDGRIQLRMEHVEGKFVMMKSKSEQESIMFRHFFRCFSSDSHWPSDCFCGVHFRTRCISNRKKTKSSKKSQEDCQNVEEKS